MISQDPRMDPNTANVIDHDLHQPYARRSIHAIIGFILLILLLGAFLGWYFLSPEQPTTHQDIRQDSTISQTTLKTRGNKYAAGSGRSKVYNFFYHVFGGIEDGLEDSPHNLDNVEHINALNIESDALFNGNSVDHLTLNQALRGEANPAYSINQNDGYRHSIYDVIGSDVVGKKGNKAGSVFDVLVHKDTGEALAVIVNDDDSRYERELKALHFKRVLKQQTDGDVLMTVTEDRADTKPDFSYSSLNKTDYISLRHLHDGQILDFEGNVAGQIDAVIYENAEAQSIYFTLRPVLTKSVDTNLFRLPFEDVQITRNSDGYDVKLTKEQTLMLAKTLFDQ